MKQNPADVIALGAWNDIRNLRPVPHPGYSMPAAAPHPVGKFENLGNIRLCWMLPETFLFMPHATHPFAFSRSNGQRVEPRRMFTDGGSVPHLVQWYADLNPWGYAPAYLLHDWLYDQHHCEVARSAVTKSYSFEDANAMLLEAIATLVAMKVCPSDDLAVSLINLAVSSPVARALWDTKTTVCPLPPDATDD